MPELWQMVLLALVGLVGGAGGGFLGIGGAIVFIPMMKLILGADAHTVIATTLVLTVCVSASSAVGHLRAGGTVARILVGMIPAAMLAATLGVWVGNQFTGPAQVWLWRLLGGFLAYVMLDNLRQLVWPRGAKGPRAEEPAAGRIPHVAASAAVGTAIGFLCGLLGIGGGSIAVPAQQAFLGVRLRTAIANSSVMMVLPCTVAAVAKHLTLASVQVDPARVWLYIAILGPTAVAGALAGSHLVYHVPFRWVRAVFILFLACASWKLLASTP
jgi:hypothetical protein